MIASLKGDGCYLLLTLLYGLDSTCFAFLLCFIAILYYWFYSYANSSSEWLFILWYSLTLLSGIPYGMRKTAFMATYSKFAFMATSGPCGQLKFMSNKANYHRFASRAVFRLPSIKLSYHTSRTAFRRSQMPPNGQGCNSQLPYSREFFMSQLSNPSKRSPRFLLTVSVNSLSLVQNSNSISQQQLYKSRTSPTKNAQYPGRYQHFNLVSTHKKITALASVAKFLVGIPLRLYTLEKKVLTPLRKAKESFSF